MQTSEQTHEAYVSTTHPSGAMTTKPPDAPPEEETAEQLAGRLGLKDHEGKIDVAAGERTLKKFKAAQKAEAKAAKDAEKAAQGGGGGDKGGDKGEPSKSGPTKSEPSKTDPAGPRK